MPVDPRYPAAYLRRTLDDAPPAVVISASGLTESLAGTGLDVLRLDPDLSPDHAAHAPFDDALSSPSDLAYIAYT